MTGPSRTFVRSLARTARANNEYSLQSAFSNMRKQHDKLEAQQEQAAKTAVSQSFVHNFTDQTTYDPFDFSYARTRYDSKLQMEADTKLLEKSAFNADEVDPKVFYCMPQLLSKYLNTSGQILHHSVTGLSPKKQKAMAKAVKRAQAFGLLSSVGKDVSMYPKRGPTL